jgi:hypothetical protein
MATMAIFSLQTQMFGVGRIGGFQLFVTLECVTDPNVQEPADATNCKLCCLMRHFPAFHTLTTTLIANSTQLSAT